MKFQGEVHPDVVHLVESAEGQDCEVLKCEYDPEGGQANRGRVYLEAKAPNGQIIFNSGWGWPVDGKFTFAMKVNGLIPWVLFTKRTESPKLAWLEHQLDEAGIPHRRNGSSFHAPILEVPENRLGAAWSILDPVDDIPDDDPMFTKEP